MFLEESTIEENHFITEEQFIDNIVHEAEAIDGSDWTSATGIRHIFSRYVKQ